jgi:hypothetical protein
VATREVLPAPGGAVEEQLEEIDRLLWRFKIKNGRAIRYLL